jgi:hypothetical protein
MTMRCSLSEVGESLAHPRYRPASLVECGFSAGQTTLRDCLVPRPRYSLEAISCDISSTSAQLGPTPQNLRARQVF